MAKLLKHLGFGSKKATPQPPKRDYSTPQSSSEQELIQRSPTRDRSTVSLATTASHISDFDSTQSAGSPAHRQGSSDKSPFGGARSKDNAGGLSPKGKGTERHSVISTGGGTEDADGAGRTENECEATVGPPPQLLDEYSDPFDLKKQIQENPELSGACAGAPVQDDDYSVPYEVKKLIREMKLREIDGAGTGSPKKGSRAADDQSSDAPMLSSHNAKSSQHRLESRDIRPKEDYDEPWEWKPNLYLMDHSGPGLSPVGASANQKGIPLMTKRTKVFEGSPEENKANFEKKPSDKVNRSALNSQEDEDDEGYTHLREEFGPEGPCQPTTAQTKSPRVGNYEEPWDLSSTQKDLEDKLKAASDRASRERANSGTSGTPVAAPAHPPEVDTRPQEGYEKPWDWKPHKKDDRPQEGYEKPWDWKPHQKDDRPPEEYEEPWDQKAKDIERDLIKAKSAKESLREAAKKQDDSRPPEEYDEPWDQKLKKLTAGEFGPKPQAAGQQSAAQQPQGQSPKKKHKMNLDLGQCGPWNAIGEKVDPRLPLEQQGWYHGSISRVDAEALLRVHKEGSYLVRMSESNKQDYSLSLKSARGFMHMKIVNRDGKFILGQFSQPFESIPQMIYHYSVSKLPIKGAEHMSLLHPVMNELL